MYLCADASQEAVLCRLLGNMAVSSAQSVSTYAQTSDTRHLLLPARQLIKLPNTDGDKLVLFYNDKYTQHIRG